MDKSRRKKILVVGAGGFTGGFICDEGVSCGYEVYAGVRSSTSRQWLGNPALKFVEFDFEDPTTLSETMRRALGEEERWDYIIYNLGATKAMRFQDFSRINYDYLRYFTEALKEAGKEPDKFLYISSLSVMGPLHESDGKVFTEKDIPLPDTKYGASKLKAEMWLHTCGLPFVIFRCTGIYGPRDKDYFLMFDSIRKGFDFSVGFRRQNLSFLYVEDLARACYLALEKSPTGEVYNIAESAVYTQKAFRKYSLEALKKKMVIPMRMPLWAVKAVSVVAEKWGVARMKPSTLNRDKYHIMRQRNWEVSTEKAERDFGFKSQVSLKEGVEKSVEWYKKEGWLK